jgi:hypothetical protein
MPEMMPRMVFRTVFSIKKQSAMLAASVKSSLRLGGLTKLTCAAPILVSNQPCVPAYRVEFKKESYQRNDIGERAEQDAQPALQPCLFDALERYVRPVPAHFANMCTHDLGDAGSIELDVTDSFPIEVHIKLDAVIWCLVDIDIGEANGNVTKVEFGETQIGKRTRD